MTITPDLSGRTLGDYMLLKKLTAGGMAHIYLGEDHKLGRRAAIKILTPEMAGTDETLRERFEREARAVAQLEHDHIVPVYQYGEIDDLYFIAMRYIDGYDFNHLMKDFQKRDEFMPIERTLYILQQIARALDHAHERGIIHRDVKPSNILLDEKDRAFLSDFGLVLWQNVEQTLGTAFGTPRYISPEQATDSVSAVPQSDVYSLAVILYEVLTNESLFTGKTPMEVALAHVTEQPTPPRTYNADIPANAQIEIMRALSKAPERRHSTATAFMSAIQAAYDLNDMQPPTALPKAPASVPANNTIAFSEEVMKREVEQQDSSPSILKNWDNQASMPYEPAPSPNTAGATNNTLLMIGGGIVVLLVLIGLLAATALSGGNNNTIAGATGQTINAEVSLELRYNDSFFAVINPNEDAILNIGNLRLNGSDADRSGENFGDRLNPNECLFIKLGNTRDSDVPSDWNCGTARATIDGAVFWRADNPDEQEFTVQTAGNTLQRCQTVGRIVERVSEEMCRVDWSQYELLED